MVPCCACDEGGVQSKDLPALRTSRIDIVRAGEVQPAGFSIRRRREVDYAESDSC
jgi:hypothetical protein